jgi:RNA polymerase sigma-70 factor (ECF subfamily)
LPPRHPQSDELLLPHLDAAYNLARWILGNDHDAADVLQDAYARALRAFPSFRGADARPWLLQITRNAAFSHLRAHRHPHADLLDHDDPVDDSSPDPAAALSLTEDLAALQSALAQLPPPHREIIVLRELEGLPYKDIAAITATSIGTVMSRLSRARTRLHQLLAPTLHQDFTPSPEASHEL